MADEVALAVRLGRERWVDPDDLAQELKAGLSAGLKLADVNTASLDSRYAVKSLANTFTANQTIEGGKLAVSDADAAGPAVSVVHTGTGATNQTPPLYLLSTGNAGAIWAERANAAPTDVLAKFRSTGSNTTVFDGVSIEYQGVGAGLGINHAGGSGPGPFYAVGTNRPISIGGSGLSLFNHSVAVNGNVTANNFIGNLAGNATTATLATQANAVRTASGNYLSPTQREKPGVLRITGSKPTGTMNWSQVVVEQLNYLEW